MRRGAKPAKAKVEAKRAITRKSLTSDGSRVRELETCLAEALEQQAATADISDAAASLTRPPAVLSAGSPGLVTENAFMSPRLRGSKQRRSL